MKTLFNLFITFLVGFVINYLLFKLVLRGILGLSIQNYVSQKIELNDSSWLNKLLIIYFVLIFTFMCNSIIYLDNTLISFTVDNIKIDVTGQFLTNLLNGLGSTGAFVIGCKLGYASALKANLGLFSRTGLTFGSGIGSTVCWKMFLTTSEYLEGVSKVRVNEKGGISVILENVSIKTEKVASLEEKLPVNSSNITSLFKNNNFN